MASDPEIRVAFHAKDGWWFDRVDPDGSVGITLTGLTSGESIDAQIVFDPDTWASIVAFVSKRGDTAEVWSAARRLHNGDVPEKT